jgi:hypothetical protein
VIVVDADGHDLADRATAAEFMLRSVQEVERFLDGLAR